jgi:hypothetical protein
MAKRRKFASTTPMCFQWIVSLGSLSTQDMWTLIMVCNDLKQQLRETLIRQINIRRNNWRVSIPPSIPEKWLEVVTCTMADAIAVPSHAKTITYKTINAQFRLPSTITKIIADSFPQTLPPNLEVLQIHQGENEKVDLQQFQFPNSLKFVSITNNQTVLPTTFPEGLTELHLHCKVVYTDNFTTPPNLNVLRIRDIGPNMGKLSKSISTLALLTFDHPLQGILPAGLEHLSLWEFDQPLAPGDFPDSVCHVTLALFSQPINDSAAWSQNITTLVMHYFDQPNRHWPPNLETLIISSYTQELENLPNSLEHLIAPCAHIKQDIPDKITSAHIGVFDADIPTSLRFLEAELGPHTSVGVNVLVFVSNAPLLPCAFKNQNRYQLGMLTVPNIMEKSFEQFAETLPPSIHTLSLGADFQTSIHCVPSSIHTIKLDHAFDGEINDSRVELCYTTPNKDYCY